MADIALGDGPFRRRRRGEGLFELPDTPETASFTTPGYEPSAGDEPEYRTPSTGPGPFGAPTGGINPDGANPPRPTLPPAPTPGPFDLGAFQREYERVTQAPGRTGTIDEYLNTVWPELFQMFPQIQQFGSKKDKIRLPDGRVIDAVTSAGLGGRGYNPFGFEGTGGGGGSASGFVFDDPYAQQLERLAKIRIDQLFQPIGQGPDATSAFDYARKQFADLQAQPGYSPQERALLETQAIEPIEALRSASKKRAVERASARGFLPSSGLHELDLRDIERGADQARATTARNLAVGEIGRRDVRQRQAFQFADYVRTAEEAKQLWQEGRYREALALADRLQALPGERLNLSLGALSGQPAAASAYGNTLFNANQAGQFNQLQQQQLWMALAQILGGL